jgi:AraC-like DNA-binding protein
LYNLLSIAKELKGLLMHDTRMTFCLPVSIGPNASMRGAEMRMAFTNEMLFDRGMAETFYGSPAESAGSYYDDDRGIVVRSELDGYSFYQDLIQFDPDAMAFTGSSTPRPLPYVGHHHQTIEGGDWLHFCLRVGGRGVERIAGYADVDQPSRSCMVTRYPSGTKIERISTPDDGWRTACLWLRPQAVLRFLETTVSRVPAHLSFLVDPMSSDVPRHFCLPLGGRMVFAMNEILACPFTGGARRAFVRSRYLEILALIYSSAVEGPKNGEGIGVTLSAGTTEAVTRAAALLATRVDRLGSLAEIAREVGLSRTRLTQSFRTLMGTSVEAYWQQCRMDRARDLLCREGVAVTDVARMLGYSESAAFSRAFTRAFEMSPTRLRAANYGGVVVPATSNRGKTSGKLRFAGHVVVASN